MNKWKDSALLRLIVAAAPALAVAVTALDGLALGVATGCVLVVSGIVAALLDNFVTEKGRVPLFMAVSAVFAGIAHLLMKAICPGIAASLGIYVPLIAVNCLLLTRPDDENRVTWAVADGVKQALGFIVLVTLLGAIREFFDVGCVFGAQLLPKGTQLSAMAALPAGGLMILGVLAGVANAVARRGARKEDEAA